MLMHPIAPAGTQKVFEYLELLSNAADFFSWTNIDSQGTPAGYDIFVSEDDRLDQSHAVRELPPRTDFFSRHPSQFQS